MNPALDTEAVELARWLEQFAVSHAKREDPRVEVEVRPGADRPTLEIHLELRGVPPVGPHPLGELTLAEVAAGRARFAWCQALAARIREEAHALVAAGAGTPLPV